MKAVLAGFLFAFTLAAGPAAQAAADPDPDPWIEFSIFNNQVSLRSLDGKALPLDTPDGTMAVMLDAQDSAGQHSQELHLAASDPVLLQMAQGAGYGELKADGLFGDMRATVGYTAPSTSYAGSYFLLDGNAVFTLPAHSMLTIGGWVQVRSGAHWDQNYVAFERGLIAGTDGAFGERYILNGSDASSQYAISAINPLDEAATFYFYSNLYGSATSNLTEAPPVPEPAQWAMLAAGAALLTGAWRKSAARGNDGFRIRPPGPFE